MRRSDRQFSVALVLIALTAASCQALTVAQPEPVVSPITSPTLTTAARASTSTTGPKVGEVVVRVVSVTDGDTIRVLMAPGEEERVRLIGIDAPEDGSVLDEEATAYLEDLVLGEDVSMVADVSDRDSFGRLLRYLYVGDLFVNEEMVRAGLASAKRYEPDTAMAHILEAAQGGAEDAALGLFSPTAPTTTVPPTTSTTIRPTTTTTTRPPTTTTVPITTTTAQANCHPSYPDFCIPPPPPDLNCGDIGYQDFTVLPPDPHGFDGNSDGVGCES